VPQPVPPFECHIRPSQALLGIYLGLLALSLIALFLASLPLWAQLLAATAALAHAAWLVPRQIRLTHPAAITALRHDAAGFALFSRQNGWQAVQLRADSLALPLLVVLRFRLPNQWFARGLCIPWDGLESDVHRRLRLRLKFARKRFQGR